MAVPKRRTSKSRKGTRRSHHHVTPKGVQYCPQCNEAVLPHRVCGQCGHYQGRTAILIQDAATEGK
jgi:large subunit ribosomal protein L32